LRWDYFGPRLLRLAYVLAPLAGWLVVLSAIYAAASAEPDHLSSRFAPDWKERWRRRISSGQWWVFILSMAALFLIVISAIRYWTASADSVSGAGNTRSWGIVLTIFLVGGMLLSGATWHVKDKVKERNGTAVGAVRRNQITRWHAKIMMVSLCAAAVLGLAGFGPNLIDYLTEGGGGNWFHDYVARSGGILAVLGAAGGAIFTAFKRAPSGGGDAR